MRALPLVLALALLVPLVPSAAADPLEGDVLLPQLTACTWSGSYKPVAHAAGVTVWAWSCDPPT